VVGRSGVFLGTKTIKNMVFGVLPGPVGESWASWWSLGGGPGDILGPRVGKHETKLNSPTFRDPPGSLLETIFVIFLSIFCFSWLLFFECVLERGSRTIFRGFFNDVGYIC
jgi:hypothetical protein